METNINEILFDDNEVIIRLMQECSRIPMGYGYDISYGTDGCQAPWISIRIEGIGKSNGVVLYPHTDGIEFPYTYGKTLRLLQRVNAHINTLLDLLAKEEKGELLSPDSELPW